MRRRWSCGSCGCLTTSRATSASVSLIRCRSKRAPSQLLEASHCMEFGSLRQRIGERVAVIGLGLVGQLTCRILAAAGCRVVGVDIVSDLVNRLRGSDIATSYIRAELHAGALPQDARDCDAVIITAATSSDDPIQLAGALARDRARVVVVGDVGLSVPRSSYYGKELELRLSRSYGPGRYDHAYEERGLDYPIGYVRWTERRNLAAFVSLLADRQVEIDDLITARVPVDDASEAYERLIDGPRSPLGLVLTYERPSSVTSTEERVSAPPRRPRAAYTPAAGVIGAGSFSQRVLVPALRDAGFELSIVASASGLSAAAAVNRLGFARWATPNELLDADDLDVVCVASRHGSHAEYAIRALKRGRAVFIEKPPALTLRELDQLRDASRERLLQVGFNRRFAPLALSMRDHVVRDGHPGPAALPDCGRAPEPRTLAQRSRARWRETPRRSLPLHRLRVLVRRSAAEPSGSRYSTRSRAAPTRPAAASPVTMTFRNGSVATIAYGSESAPGVEKELVEAHCAGRSAMLHDFRRLELRNSSRTRVLRTRRQDKGHCAQALALRRALDGLTLART